MKFLFECTSVFLLFISIVWSKNCETTDGYSCVFPFKYGNREYTICTTVDKLGSPWCATYTPYTRSYWGYCPTSCYTCGLSASISRSCNDDVLRYASNTDFPWHVLIRKKEKIDFVFCSGIIANDQWVITTGSCLNIFFTQKRAKKVQVGSSKMIEQSDIQILDVEKTVIHEGFDETTGVNDIALIKTVGKFKFTDLVLSLCMNIDRSIIHQGAKGTMSGITNVERKVLQADRVTIIQTSYKVCRHPGVFCTGPNTALKAMASGASLAMCFNGKCALAGLHSTRTAAFSPDFTKFYSFTNIAYYLPWIYKNGR
nr:trypsin-1-like isoform X2 [Lepeophtheirus salmonis]